MRDRKTEEEGYTGYEESAEARECEADIQVPELTKAELGERSIES